LGGGWQHSHTTDRRSASRKRLTVTLALVAAYMVAELAGGLLTNSLALLADAGHMLSDVAALALSLFASRLADRPPTAQRTYGYYRAEILAALANGATLAAIALFTFFEAYRRFASPPQVKSGAMIGIACGGLLVNIASLAILHAGRAENLNVRGVWLHVLTDALGSIQAITAGALIAAFGWLWADPAASVLIGLLILYSAWSLLRESTAVLMEGVPGHLDLDEVRDAVLAVGGVTGLHDLHVWTVTSGFIAMSAHLEVGPDSPDGVLWQVRAMLRDRFGIEHSTIQVERGPAPVDLAFVPPGEERPGQPS
jgi:cobalt-zinc-cadmium efflux system protein